MYSNHCGVLFLLMCKFGEDLNDVYFTISSCYVVVQLHNLCQSETVLDKVKTFIYKIKTHF